VQDLDLQRQPKAGGLAPARPRGERGRYVQYTEHRAPDPARGREPEPPGPGRCRRARVGEPELESLVRPRVVADLAELVALGRDPAEEGAVRLVILGDELADMERRRTGRARPAEADEGVAADPAAVVVDDGMDPRSVQVMGPHAGVALQGTGRPARDTGVAGGDRVAVRGLGESDRGCFFVVRQRAGPETVRLQLADQLPAEGPVEGRPERVEHAEDIAPLAPLAERMATERTPDAPTPRRGRRRNAREPQHGERDAGDVLGHPVRTVGAEQPASLLRDPGDLEPAVRHAALELADPVLDGPLARERLRPEERERPQVGALRAADLDRFLPGHPPCLSA